jgi:methionyl-tRNA synthetase
VLYHAAECLRIVSGLLLPVMPGKMAELRRALGLGAAAAAPALEGLSRWGGLSAGAAVADLDALFPRIEAMPVAPPVAVPVVTPTPLPPTAPAVVAPAVPEGIALIGIADVSRVHLRVARVQTAERIAGSDRLLKLTLEVGAETRQIVAGIARFYDPATLIGRSVIVVANLKPATLFGVESNGMLLAAKQADRLHLLTVDGEIASGAPVG